MRSSLETSYHANCHVVNLTGGEGGEEGRERRGEEREAKFHVILLFFMEQCHNSSTIVFRGIRD